MLESALIGTNALDSSRNSNAKYINPFMVIQSLILHIYDYIFVLLVVRLITTL